MSSKTSPAPSSAVHPPIGTLIDGDSLELVEVLGVGGYGVVYRAVDVRHPTGPKSYAVKCLVASGHQTARQRQIHIREIALHQIASAHPGVVTLHRIVEHFNHTYIIMDYAPDHDLFTQILHSCRYLGDDALIKDVFLQLLDAVDYCHTLGIYHRDLKPENVLCFDDGLRVAITDFGLATTEKVSDEFRTGSVYHMSPECQGGEFAPTGNYSPMFNDIWSLGIILLNLATGRNPWKSATADDPTFQAYLRDPINFLPSVLPISSEVNDILMRMLEVDWQQRMTLREVRYAIEEVTSFYSDGVIFEGSMARCPWESGMEIDSASSANTQDGPSPQSSPQPTEALLNSRWSKDSSSDIVFASQASAEESNYGIPWNDYSSCSATWAFESPISSDSEEDHFRMDLFGRPDTPSSASDSPASSMPATPNNFDMTFIGREEKQDPRAALTIDTNLTRPRIYDANASMTSFSTQSSMMHTAIEYDPYASLFFVSSPVSPKGHFVPDSAITAVAEDKEMISPSVWTSSGTEMSSPSIYSSSSSASSIDKADDDVFPRSSTPSPEPNWLGFSTQVRSPPIQQCQLSSSVSASMTDVPSHSRPSILSSRKPGNGKSKTASRFGLKLFPRASPSQASPASPATPLPHERSAFKFRTSFASSKAPTAAFESAAWNGISAQMATTQPQPNDQNSPSSSTSSTSGRRNGPLRNWLISGRFFTSAGIP